MRLDSTVDFQPHRIFPSSQTPESFHFILLHSFLNFSGLLFPIYITKFPDPNNNDSTYYNLNNTNKHISNVYFAIVLTVDEVSSPAQKRFSQQMCETYRGNTLFPHGCTVTGAHKLAMVFSKAQDAYKMEELCVTWSYLGLPKRVPLLFLWYDIESGHVSKGIVLHADAQQLSSGIVCIENCSAGQQCLQNLYSVYNTALLDPSYCIETRSDIFPVPSKQKPLKEIGCYTDSQHFLEGLKVSTHLESSQGQYPESGHLILTGRTSPLFLISSEGVKVSRNNSYPYVSSFAGATWAAIVVSVLAVVTINVGLTWQISTGDLGSSLVHVLLWNMATFVDQIGGMNWPTRVTAGKIHVVLTILTALMLTDVYRCALLSEFSITLKPQATIRTVQAANENDLYVVFDDSQWDIVSANRYLSAGTPQAPLDGLTICALIDGETHQCEYIEKMLLMRENSKLLTADPKSYYFNVMKTMQAVADKIHYICIKEVCPIIGNFENTGHKAVFLISQESFAVAWKQFKIETATRNKLVFAYGLRREPCAVSQRLCPAASSETE